MQFKHLLVMLILLVTNFNIIAMAEENSIEWNLGKSHNLDGIPKQLYSQTIPLTSPLVIEKNVRLQVELPKSIVFNDYFQFISIDWNKDRSIQNILLRKGDYTAREAFDIAKKYLSDFGYDSKSEDKLRNWLNDRLAAPTSRIVLELNDNNKPVLAFSIRIFNSFDDKKPWIVFLAVYFK